MNNQLMVIDFNSHFGGFETGEENIVGPYIYLQGKE